MKNTLDGNPKSHEIKKAIAPLFNESYDMNAQDDTENEDTTSLGRFANPETPPWRIEDGDLGVGTL